MNKIITTAQNLDNKDIFRGSKRNFGFILESKRERPSNDADVACSVNNNNDEHSRTKISELDVRKGNGNNNFLKCILTSLLGHKPQEQSTDWSNHDKAIKFVKFQTLLGTKDGTKSDNMLLLLAKKPC